MGPEEFARIIDEVDRRIPHTHVLAVEAEARPPERCLEWRDLIVPDNGTTPARRWRDAFAAATARQYSRPAPPGMPEAFVLQFALNVLAAPAAMAAITANAVLDTEPSNVAFSLAMPYAYPDRILLRPGHSRWEPDATRCLEAAQARYRRTAEPFARHVDLGAKMSTRQRLGMVGDCWAMAVRDAEANVHGIPRKVVERTSCCLIYALPGCHECAGCPRTGRVSRPDATARP